MRDLRTFVLDRTNHVCSLLKEIASECQLDLNLIEEFCSLSELIQHSINRKPEVVIIALPHNDEICRLQELVSFIQYASRDTGIIVISAEKSIQVIRKAVEDLADFYLALPTEKNSLAECLKHLRTKTGLKTKTVEYVSKLEHHIEQVLPYVRSQLVYDLIYGNIISVREVWERLELAGLTAVPTNAMVVSIKNFERVTANKSEMWKTRLRNDVQIIVEQSLSHLSTVLAAPVDKHLITVLFGLPKGTMNARREITELSKSICEAVERQLFFSLTVALGRKYSDARNLHLSYQECITALQYNFHDNYQIVHIEDVEPYHETITYSLEQERLLTAFVRLGNTKETERILRKIYDEYVRKHLVKPNITKTISLQLIAVMIRAAIEGGVDEHEGLTSSTQYMSEVMQSESLRDLTELMVDVCVQLTRRIKEERSRSVSYSTKRVIEFLTDNINKNISLEQIAQEIHLSPFYLSHLFKRETGLTITEYLAKLRLKEAQRLLLDRHWSIMEVARLVGYQNPNYFSRIFKKEFGLPPSEYRHKHN